MTMRNTRVEMRDAVFFEGADVRSRLSRFWLLLVLAAIIATSGVIGDSEATVIGAMIVAPLRIPILGTMLAIVLGDRRNLVRSATTMLGGAAAAIGIGYVMAVLSFNEGAIASSSQIDTWSQARLIDLIAALAVGVVGSIALVRRDIADTVPGVAIAISLVPPLTVVGMSIRADLGDQAWGAFLLFATNVSAILGVGVVTMALYRVRQTDERSHAGDVPDHDRSRPINQRQAYIVIAVSLIVIFAVLTERSVSVAQTTRAESLVDQISGSWADTNEWELIRVVTGTDGVIVARFEGPSPVPSTDSLRDQLAEGGVELDEVRLDFVPKETVTFDQSGSGE